MRSLGIGNSRDAGSLRNIKHADQSKQPPEFLRLTERQLTLVSKRANSGITPSISVACYSGTSANLHTQETATRSRKSTRKVQGDVEQALADLQRDSKDELRLKKVGKKSCGASAMLSEPLQSRPSNKVTKTDPADAKLSKTVAVEEASSADRVSPPPSAKHQSDAKPVLTSSDGPKTTNSKAAKKRRTAKRSKPIPAATPDLGKETVSSRQGTPRKRSNKRKMTTEDPAAEPQKGDETPRKAQRSRRKKSDLLSEAAAQDDAEMVKLLDEDADIVIEQVAKRRTKKEYPDITVTLPPPDSLPSLHELHKDDARPVPNLGYACLNMLLRSLKIPLYTNRDCVKKTLDAKGIAYVSQLALQNVKDLPYLIQWNEENNIKFFRMSSCLVPWMTSVRDLSTLPDFPAIVETLRYAGDLARAYNQRLTFHPSHFVKLAAPDEELLNKSMTELEVHSQIFDLMGYPPSPWNKINIHIGGVYNSKEETLERFAENFARLSPNCRRRLTLENDDWRNAFALSDLLPLSRKTGIPLVFDFHHHKFCPGTLSEKDAFFAAIGTWPAGVRPVVHWSESQEGRKASAHSDYVYGPINLHGKEKDVDVMIEAKGKEQALVKYRELAEKMAAEGPSVALKFL